MEEEQKQVLYIPNVIFTLVKRIENDLMEIICHTVNLSANIHFKL